MFAESLRMFLSRFIPYTGAPGVPGGPGMSLSPAPGLPAGASAQGAGGLKERWRLCALGGIAAGPGAPGRGRRPGGGVQNLLSGGFCSLSKSVTMATPLNSRLRGGGANRG